MREPLTESCAMNLNKQALSHRNNKQAKIPHIKRDESYAINILRVAACLLHDAQTWLRTHYHQPVPADLIEKDRGRRHWKT